MNSEFKDLNENDLPVDGDEAVSRLIGGLRRADAPGNFERRVMTTIAERRDRRPRFFRMPVLAYAVSLVLVVLVAGFVVLNLRQPDAAQPEVSSTLPARSAPAPTVQNEVTPTPEDLIAAQPNEPDAPAATDSSTRAASKNVSNSKRADRGGTVTFGQGQAKQVMPEGIEPDRPQSDANQGDVVTSSTISVSDLLDPLGLTVVYGTEFRVTAVRQNSVAARSGVRVGDTLVSLDDKQLRQGTAFSSSGSFSTITVRREGKLVSLKLQ